MKIFIVTYRHKDENFTFIFEQNFFSKVQAEEKAREIQRATYRGVITKVVEVTIEEGGFADG